MEYLGQQHIDRQDEFELLLLSFWSQFCVTWWELERPMAKLKGPELLLFIENAPSIINFLRTKFPGCQQAKKIGEVLMLWNVIIPFLNITYIDDKASYQTKLDKFVSDLKKFYLVGGETFLSTNYAGDEENFHAHCVRFFLPKIAEVTLEKHNMGLGIFTMQGFEHRNKESKMCFLKFTKKGNVCIQVMKRLWDLFFNQTVWKARKKTKKEMVKSLKRN